MKTLTIVFISILFVGQVLGRYKPTKDEDQSFESDDQSTKRNELRHDNKKYRFDFEVQEPELPKEENEAELKSFAYKVKSPITENPSQVPIEWEPTNSQSQDIYSGDDNIEEDKPGCTCQYGNCPLHKNEFSLPVSYESDSDYVVYDYPERFRRQISQPFAGVNGMMGEIRDAVKNVANSFGSQRLQQGTGLFASASGFLPEQREDRVAQVTDLVGKITEHITDAVQSSGRAMSSQQSEQQSGLLGQAPIIASKQSQQPFTRITNSVEDITGHITGMVRDTTKQATEIMNRFKINKDDSNGEERGVNNVNERKSLNFLESVRRSRQVDSNFKILLQQIAKSLPKGDSNLLSQIGIEQNSGLRAQAEGIMQDLRGGRFSGMETRLREIAERMGSNKNQELPIQETLQQHLGMSSDESKTTLAKQIQLLFQQLSQNGDQADSRKKRSVNTANEWYERQIPVLKVKERPNETIENFKRLSESRVELYAPECLRHSPESHSSHDHNNEEKKCGTHLTDESMCKSCGMHQSQYFEYVDGQPISYHPKTTEKRSSETTNPRYVFDRYGHRYREHNGHLRLMAPQSHHDEYVGSPPNYFGLRNILDQNRDVMHDLNRNGPRMIPRPSEYIQDTIHYIHELARRGTKRDDNENKKSSDTNQKKLKSVYQILPVRYNGKNGEMVTKIYSAKDRDDEYHRNNQQTKVAEKSKPTVSKFRKNSKEYEILTFDNN